MRFLNCQACKKKHCIICFTRMLIGLTLLFLVLEGFVFAYQLGQMSVMVELQKSIIQEQQ